MRDAIALSSIYGSICAQCDQKKASEKSDELQLVHSTES